MPYLPEFIEANKNSQWKNRIDLYMGRFTIDYNGMIIWDSLRVLTNLGIWDLFVLDNTIWTRIPTSVEKLVYEGNLSDSMKSLFPFLKKYSKVYYVKNRGNLIREDKITLCYEKTIL